VQELLLASVTCDQVLCTHYPTNNVVGRGGWSRG